MPDLLGATNPVPGYDKAVTNRASTQVQPNPAQLQNVPDLTKVSRADHRTEQQGSDLNGSGTIRYSSNFQTFIQRMRESGGLAEILRTIFSGRHGTVVLSGMQEGTALEMAKLLEMMRMDEAQLNDFFLSQIKSGTKFGGALFALLRKAYANAGSETLRTDILQFLKSYVDFSSTQHIQQNMLRDLARMADAMPARWGDPLRQMLAQLQNALEAGDRKGALQLLQKNIVMHMSNYVTQTHDMGLPRELLGFLTLDIARYENGSVEKLLDYFHQLRGYGTLKTPLGMIDDQSLLTLLQQSGEQGDSVSVRFSDALSAAAAHALRGDGSMEVQEGFQNLVASMLLNESVYMPLNHYVLPLEWNGQFAFSELWIDPDAEQEESAAREGRGGPVTRVLLKIDVQSLGFFDVVISSQKDSVDLFVACPEKLSPFTGEMERALTQILTRNDLKPTRVAVRNMEQPVTLTEVFPNLFQGRNGVNVKV